MTAYDAAYLELALRHKLPIAARDGTLTHTNPMTWQLHPARNHFPAFAAAWDRLNGELYNHHPFFDSRFIGPLLEYFADGIQIQS